MKRDKFEHVQDQFNIQTITKMCNKRLSDYSLVFEQVEMGLVTKNHTNARAVFLEPLVDFSEITTIIYVSLHLV